MGSRRHWYNLYNLSDIIRFRFEKGLHFGEDRISYAYLSKMENDIGPGFPPNWNKHFDVDFNLLRSIVDEKTKIESNEETFVIHARTGDVINKTIKINEFIEVIKKYKLNSNYKKCEIVTGNHRPRNLERSADYVDNLKNEISLLGIECSIISESVDEDFIRLANAKCFIAGYGGFSWLSACINYNKTIWDLQNPPKFPWNKIGGYNSFFIDGFQHQQQNSNDGLNE